MPAAKNPVLAKAIKASAEPQRARQAFERLAGLPASQLLESLTPGRASLLAALFCGSQPSIGLLLAHPDWIPMLDPEALKYPRRKQGLRKEVNAWMTPLLETGDHPALLRRVLELKQREMLRIAARDLGRIGRIPEITQEISDVADVCLEAVWQVCLRQLVQRHGQPWHQDSAGRWQPTPGCVIGLGKLGGQELNYSSDVDVVFVYGEDGGVFKEPPAPGKTPRPVLANQQFFIRLAELFIAEIGRMAGHGMLYRIDLRLRPEGDSGRLNRSLAGYENYYAQWGQTWERMMLIKARGVAGDTTLAAEFLEMIQPFRYPRSISENALTEVGAMKDRIENEVVRSDELDRNVKLGHGGIREIEFIVQSIQLLNAGRQPFLQTAQTLPCLDKLVQYGRLAADESRALGDAYCFLRDVEHRLQMDDDRQTHTIPSDAVSCDRLARLMGFTTYKEFETARAGHAAIVRQVFERMFKSDAPTAKRPFPEEFQGEETTWQTILTAHSFKDAGKAFRVLREFVEGPGYVHVSRRTMDLAYGLLPRLFGLCPQPQTTARAHPCASQTGRHGPAADQPPLSDPDRVVTRLDSFIAAYGARSTLFELWNSNPAIFELLLLLFDRSEFLAELAIRTPDLVDELVTSGRLRQRKTAEETLRDLRHGLDDEDQHLWLRRYHQAELMRIGLRDILGLADFEQYLAELSALADACLQYALEVAMRRNHFRSPPFAIIGLGKLGGVEIDYGSDLDIIFVADSKAKNLPKLSQAAVQVLDLLSLRTEQGATFQTDARLRPDGEKGLMVNTLKGYEDYYRQRAQLWEIQTLTRTRAVAGDLNVGARFQTLAGQLANFERPSLPLAAYAPDWKQRIARMRLRIEKERTPAGKDDLAIKTGSGGLVDAEFIAQALCLQNGWQEPNTLRALERGRDAGLLPDAAKLIDNYRLLRRVEGILRRWSYEGETVLPDDPAPYYRVSVRCGYPSPEAFREALAACRRAIREVYLKLLPP